MACLKLMCLFLCFNISLCQFGFFPQRDERRIMPVSPFGFIQNLQTNADRFRNRVSGILHLRPENGNDAYVVNDRPVDQYQDPRLTNNVRFPGQDIPNDSVNFEVQSTMDPVGVNRNDNSGVIKNNNQNTEFTQGLISGAVATEPSFGNRDNGFIFGGKDNSNIFNDNSNGFENRNGVSEAASEDNTNNVPRNSNVQFDDTCDTAEGEVGTCISLMKCEPYLKLVKQAQTDPRSRTILQKSHCGFEKNLPKVCCPRPGIPSAPPIAEQTTPRAVVESSSDSSPIQKNMEAGDYVTAFPEPPVCGVSKGTFGRVVGGVNASLGDFPWIALLGYQGKRDATTRWRCGGSLITALHVLTAAHCIHNHEEDLYVVRLGELDLSRDDDGATPIDVLIKKKIKHEQYNSASFENDIGILVLQQAVQFVDLIRPICIPFEADLRSQTFERLTPMIAGWGDTQFRGPSANHLQVVQLPVQTNELCAKAYAKYPKQVIDERVLCAGYKNGGKDACQGDSGGPLMMINWSNVTYKSYFYQIGVVSYGKNCAEAGFPGVYSRITYFLPWLEKTVLGI